MSFETLGTKSRAFAIYLLQRMLAIELESLLAMLMTPSEIKICIFPNKNRRTSMYEYL